MAPTVIVGDASRGGGECRKAAQRPTTSQDHQLEGANEPMTVACLQCGTPARSATSTFCARCGLPYGAPPRADADLPSCHVCYRTVDDDGRLESLDRPGSRVDLQRHLEEHDRHPVGDDDYLESLRAGDRIR